MHSTRKNVCRDSGMLKAPKVVSVPVMRADADICMEWWATQLLCRETSHVGAAVQAQSHIMGNSLKGKAHNGDKEGFINLFTSESFQDVLY